MGLSIHLLGPPRMERGGSAGGRPRAATRPGACSRTSFAAGFPRPGSGWRACCFPRPTIRWGRSAGRSRPCAAGWATEAELGGDPLRLTLPPGTFVDVDVLSRGSWMEAIALPGLGHELLDGLAFRSSPGFEMWLESERRHVAGTTSARAPRRPRSRCSREARAADAARHAVGARRAQPLRGERPRPARPLPACGGRFRGRGASRRGMHRALQARARASSRLLRFARRLPPPRWRSRLASRGERQCGRRSRPARRRSPPARSKPVCTVCAAPSRPLEGSATASSSRRRSSRWAARSSTRPAARTRKAPPRCTKERRSRSRPDGSTSPRRDGARSAGSSSCVRTTNERRSR